MSCIICGSSFYRVVFKEEEIDIVSCSSCGHVYSSFSGSSDYSNYFPDDIDRQDHSWWNKGHQRMFRYFRDNYLPEPSGHLLDIGCGLGYFLKSIKDDQRTSSWNAAGIEICGSAVCFAREQLGLSDIFLGKIEEAKLPFAAYNWVTMWDVIEHILDPRPMLSSIKRLLSPSGRLFIATPNIKIQLPKAYLKRLLFKNDSHILEARDHLQNYSPDSISRLLKNAGFNNVEFIQLPPVSLVSGHQGSLMPAIKEIWYQLARMIFYLSGRRWNFNNIYVIASLK